MSEKNPSTILPLINYCMNQVSTNMSVTEIYNIAKDVLGTENLLTQQAGIPQEGMYTPVVYEGMQVLEIDLDASKKLLDQLLY